MLIGLAAGKSQAEVKRCSSSEEVLAAVKKRKTTRCWKRSSVVMAGKCRSANGDADQIGEFAVVPDFLKYDPAPTLVRSRVGADISGEKIAGASEQNHQPSESPAAGGNKNFEVVELPD